VVDPEQGRISWRKSAASAGGDCAEVAFADELVLMRHSRDPSGPVLSFSQSEWAAFLVGVRSGEFDVPTTERS
jgi:predicted secreted Zn-dependent protease